MISRQSSYKYIYKYMRWECMHVTIFCWPLNSDIIVVNPVIANKHIGLTITSNSIDQSRRLDKWSSSAISFVQKIVSQKCTRNLILCGPQVIKKCQKVTHPQVLCLFCSISVYNFYSYNIAPSMAFDHQLELGEAEVSWEVSVYTTISITCS